MCNFGNGNDTWKSHMVTQRHRAPELTLVPKLKINLSEVNDMLNLMWYLQNPQYVPFFEALSDDSDNEVVGNVTKTDSDCSSSG
jgi:hypothetical protein